MAVAAATTVARVVTTLGSGTVGVHGPGTSTAFTLMGWFKASASSNGCWFACEDDASAVGYLYFGVYADGSESVIWYEPGGNIGGVWDQYTEFTDGIDPDLWLHLIFEFDNGQVNIYLSSEDGTYDLDLIATFTATSADLGSQTRVLAQFGADAAMTNCKLFTHILADDAARREERDRYKSTETAWAIYPMDRAPVTGPQSIRDMSGSERPMGVNVFGSGLTDADGPAILDYDAGGLVRVATSAVATGTTSLSITTPTTNVLPLDLQILAFAHQGAGYGTVPAGWTLLNRVTDGTTRLESYWKRNGFVGTVPTSEPSSVSITGLATVARGFITTYRGPDHLGSPVLLSAARSNAAGTLSSLTDGLADIEAGSLFLTLLAAGTTTGLGSPGPAILGSAAPAASADRDFGGLDRFITNTSGMYLYAADMVKHSPGDVPPLFWSSAGGTQPASLTLAIAIRAETQPWARRFYFSRQLPAWSTPTFGFQNEGVAPARWDWSGPAPYGPAYNLTLLVPRRDAAGFYSETLLAQSNNSAVQVSQCAARYVLPLKAQTLPDDWFSTLVNVTRAFYNFRFPNGDLGQNEDNDVRYNTRMYLTDGNRANHKSEVKAFGNDSAEWNNTRTWRAFVETLSPMSPANGDCLFLEKGISIQDQPTSIFDETYPTIRNYSTARMAGGGVSRNGASTQAVYSPLGLLDGPTSGTSVSAVFRTPWIEFSEPLLFADMPVANVNDSMDDRTVLPGTVPQVVTADTRNSQSNNRSAYYEFTPEVSGRYIFSLLGSSYSAIVQLFTTPSPAALTGSGHLTAVEQEEGVGSIYDLEAETTYYIRVRTEEAFNESPSAGGYLRLEIVRRLTPQPDDVFYPVGGVLLVYREGQLINATFQLGALAPLSGIGIDYTKRPLVSLDGPTHADERLAVAAFGQDFITLLDLRTLNAGETEIDDIFSGTGDPISGTPANMSTLEIDVLGKLFVGWFGFFNRAVGQENTAWEAAAAQSLARMAVQETDAAYGDNNAPPGGWPQATQHLVEPEKGGSDYVRLRPDGTLLYSSGGQYVPISAERILAYDPATTTQLVDFLTNLPAGTGPNPGPKGIAIHPTTGDVFICNGSRVSRYTSAGAFVRHYTPSPANYAMTLADVDFTNDGLNIIVLDSSTSSLFKFNIATGVQAWHTWTRAGFGNSTSFVVYRPNRFDEPEEPPHSDCECCVATQLQVTNLALLRIGVSATIASLDEASREAYTGNLLFEHAIKAVLRAHPWAFATKYADATDEIPGYMDLVAGTASDPVNKDWTYAYSYPPDCLFARRLVKEGSGRQFDDAPIPFRKGRLWNSESTFTDDVEVIFTNEPDAVLEYTAFIECAENFADQLFIDSLVWYLAAAMAPSLSRIPDAVTMCQNAFKNSLTISRTVDVREQQQEPVGEAEWIREGNR